MPDEREAYFDEDGEPNGKASFLICNQDEVQVTVYASGGMSLSVVLNADEWFTEMRRLQKTRCDIWFDTCQCGKG